MQSHYVEGENNDCKKRMKNCISQINCDIRMENSSLIAENLSIKNASHQTQSRKFLKRMKTLKKNL